MKTQLIKFSDGKVIIISDEPIEVDDLCFDIVVHPKGGTEQVFYKKKKIVKCADISTEAKIIASNYTSMVPGIDLSLVDIGVVDSIDALAERLVDRETDARIDNPIRKYYEKYVKLGFNECLRLNKEKKYTMEELIDFVEFVNDYAERNKCQYKLGRLSPLGTGEDITFEALGEKYSVMLSTPTIYNVQIEMVYKDLLGNWYPFEDYMAIHNPEFYGDPSRLSPKITDNKIKVLKIL